MNEVLALTCELIRRRSVTPDDAGCQDLIADRLDALGFVIERMPFGRVDNLWARRGNAGPVLCFAGHTDVVPPGPRADWLSDPFEPDIRDGVLYGRGAADMKGGLAAMVVAVEQFVRARPDHATSLAFLITSDEEGVATDGTRRVVETLQARGEQIRWCLVGEPGSATRLGDMVRVGRRGSLHGALRVRGVQGHVAYPEKADNPIHRAAPALAALAAERWDGGNEHFPPTSMQVSNVNAGTGADNVIPGTLEALFNFRYSTVVTADELRQRTHAIFDAAGLDYTIDWRLSGEPFLTDHGDLVAAVRAAIVALTGTEPALSTAGGTSDGRFIAPTGAEVVEVGPVNATIHKVNECVRVEELESLVLLYRDIAERLDSRA